MLHYMLPVLFYAYARLVVITAYLNFWEIQYFHCAPPASCKKWNEQTTLSLSPKERHHEIVLNTCYILCHQQSPWRTHSNLHDPSLLGRQIHEHKRIHGTLQPIQLHVHHTGNYLIRKPSVRWCPILEKFSHSTPKAPLGSADHCSLEHTSKTDLKQLQPWTAYSLGTKHPWG